MALSGSAGTACIAGLLRSFCCAPSAACPPSGRIIQRSLGSASCHRQQARDAPGRGEAPRKLTRLLMRAGSSRTSRLGVGAAGRRAELHGHPHVQPGAVEGLLCFWGGFLCDGPGCCADLVLPLEREGARAGWEEPCGLC